MRKTLSATGMRLNDSYSIIGSLFRLPQLCRFQPVVNDVSLGSVPDQNSAFEEKLDAQILDLSVRAYERLIAHLLRAWGYEDVRILRDHSKQRRSHKGRTAHGGVDITANLCAEFGLTPILVQVKQYQRPISRRFVDELRGALLRTQARQGILITTSVFADGARSAALEDHIGPIHLIDGTQLRAQLINHKIGINRNKRGHLTLRTRYFRRLDKLREVDPNNQQHGQ